MGMIGWSLLLLPPTTPPLLLLLLLHDGLLQYHLLPDDDLIFPVGLFVLPFQIFQPFFPHRYYLFVDDEGEM